MKYKLKEEALASETVYVLQEFRKGSKFSHPYFDFNDRMMKVMNGRVRLTPYYSVETGELLTAKATMCEGTNYIHAMLDSINVPVK